MATGTGVMKNFFSVLKNYSQESGYIGRIALDEAVKAVSPVNDFSETIILLEAGLFSDEIPEFEGLDSDAKLQKLTGIVLGADDDYNADTGAISGSNAGGAVKKTAADIVPESGDLSTATLPTAGSTTPITYTGDDGKTFTFNVKWPESYTKFISGTAVDSETNISNRMKDSRFQLDLNDFAADEYFYKDDLRLLMCDSTYGTMKESAITIAKGLNTYWLKESAKLIYDSYGLDFDEKTIEIKFFAGGAFGDASGITVAKNDDNLPSNEIILGINLAAYGKIDPTNPNGLQMMRVVDTKSNDISMIDTIDLFLDRVVAHEMVHAAMMASGTTKDLGMTRFFGEGVADLIQGDDDYNSQQTDNIKKLVADSDTFIKALSFDDSESGSIAYPAGNMLLRFIAWQSSDTSIFVGNDGNKSQTIDFNGNTTIITNYDESNTINYDTDFKTARISNTFNDFVAKTYEEESDGLIVRNARGKLISFTSQAGEAYATMAENAGEVDGRTLGDGNKYEILFGANNVSNNIRAGNGGSLLWGGYLGNDELYGGAGADTFIYDINGGNDTVHNAESNDIVLLRNVDLSQITSAQITDNGVSISFSYGGSLNVEGQPTTFVLEDNDTSYTADYQNKTWSLNE